ncbi:transposase [Streptomyces sp. NPDC005122]
MRDRLDGLWRDEDFVDRYPRDGRPSLSPAQLATVSVLQFLLGLCDRDAAEAVRCRLDFKYALGLDLADPGSTTACSPISVTDCSRRAGAIGFSTSPWPASESDPDWTEVDPTNVAVGSN